MRRALSAGLFILMAATGAACSETPQAEPRPGDVLLRDDSGSQDEIRLYFEGGASGQEAIAALEQGAAVEVTEVEVEQLESSGLLRVSGHAEVGERTGFLRHRVGIARVWKGEANRVFVEIPVQAIAKGLGDPVQRDPFTMTYLAEPGGSVEYEISLPRLVVPILLALLVAAAPYPLIRWRVRRLRTADKPKVDKLHRLQRTVLACSMIAPILVLGGLFATGALSALPTLIAELIPAAPAGLLAATGVAFVIVAALGVILASVVPAQRYYRELRDIRQEPSERRKNVLRGIVLGAALPLLWVVGSNLLETVVPEGLGRVLLYVGYLVVIFAMSPLLIRATMGKGQVDPGVKEDLLAFTREQGLRVRDIGVIKGRGEKHGNALIAGILPGLKYIFVTDYLVDNLSREELRAIVAHEIGHGKKHHLLLKMAIPFGVLLPLWGLFFLLDAVGAISSSARVLIALAPIVVIVSLFVLRGYLSLRMEKAADDYAADLVGVEPTVSALGKLAEMNMAKRDTGKIFNLLTEHPNIDERISRLQERDAPRNEDREPTGALSSN